MFYSQGPTVGTTNVERTNDSPKPFPMGKSHPTCSEEHTSSSVSDRHHHWQWPPDKGQELDVAW